MLPQVNTQEPLAIDGPSGHPILKLMNLRKSFGKLEVIRGISLEVNRGEVVSIIGASGSGKSTLLRCINYLEIPDSGDVIVDGTIIGRGTHSQAIRKVRMELGMVFQQFNLWPHLTAIENVMLSPRRAKKMSKREAFELARECLAKVRLLEKATEYPARLSGGQQQRVGIARALAMRPKVLLFDEPTSSLDPELIGEVLEVMKDLGRDGTTMVVVTHEMQFARDASDKIIFLHQGMVEESGTPQQIFTSQKSERCQAFLSRMSHQ